MVCYFLQIKDRHNGNILIDRDGHIIHIDYGFMLSSSPGNLQFEKAPFKLPLEFIDVMTGRDSIPFNYFKSLISWGFSAIRKNYQKIRCLIELMINAGGGKMACFQSTGEVVLNNLHERFAFHIPEQKIEEYTNSLVTLSAGNWRTEMYDNFQYFSNGIL
uniref:PI3K/PI4K catalytic domain-containing protein n=1 Tax=Arcella intermedia TaxID=1963864 RepID=A0A6B2LLQ2_9EUKA